MDQSKKALKFFMTLLLFVVLSFAYLYPGTSLLFSNNQTQVMSDGTDIAPSPFIYGIILDHARHSPSALFSGAIPTEQKNAPEGAVLWVPWMEKIFAILSGPFVSIEQMSTAYAFFLLIMNAMSFYLMGRIMQWTEPVKIAGSIAFSFSAYARARAKVHTGLVGIYHLPLIFGALYLLKKKEDKKSMALASVMLFVAALANHYYLIAIAFFSPLYLLYLFSGRKKNQSISKLIKRTLLAALPAILITTYSFAVPLFKNSTVNTKNIYAEQSVKPSTEVHPFLYRFRAHLIDFFTGDIALDKGHDINPLRKELSSHVADHLNESNPHERTNGIRWIVWTLFFWGAINLFSKKSALEKELKTSLYFFAFMAAVALIFSLGPTFFEADIGPVLILHRLMPQFRVTSRLGVEVQFAILLFALLFLNDWLLQHKNKISKVTKLSWALPLLMLIDYPPFLNAMPTSAVLPKKEMLVTNAPCGTGLTFPYTSDVWSVLDFYYLEQRLRGSDCKIIGNSVLDKKEKFLIEHFGLQDKTISRILKHDPALMKEFVSTVKCLNIDWIIFNKKMPEDWIKQTCHDLGFSLLPEHVCRKAASKNSDSSSHPECFNE